MTASFYDKDEILLKGSYFHVSGIRPCLNAITSIFVKLYYSSNAPLPSGPVLYLICTYKLRRSSREKRFASIWSEGTCTWLRYSGVASLLY
jgi:hypothetical protein